MVLYFTLLEKLSRNFPTPGYMLLAEGKASQQKMDNAEQGQQNIIKELNISEKVFLLGPKKQKYLCRYYSASDVCVVPSYYEPFGTVPLESMACGTPVVASRTGGLQFSIKDGITLQASG